MHWLADECVAALIVARLREAGHDAVYFAEEAAGAPDSEVVQRAVRDRRLLLTEDKDFGELIFRRLQTVPGLVLLRLGSEDAALKWSRLESAIGAFGETLFGRYTVVEGSRLRSRPLRISPPL